MDGTFFNENRTPVSYDELPDHLVKALVATEDERFYEHSGVDARGTLRALAFLGTKGGASTITQQLSKLLFTGGSKNIVERIFQKIKDRCFFHSNCVHLTCHRLLSRSTEEVMITYKKLIVLVLITRLFSLAAAADHARKRKKTR